MSTASFLLNGEELTAEVSASTTVLDWLRGAARLTGTKEGCAEGDCGACTIAIRSPGTGGWRAVNACLLLVPQLDGCEVLTIEGQADPGGALHPIQQAMVEADATQCGFCTPGFVMAIFAFREGGEDPTDATIHDALAGNLCRCTGYRSIVDACRKVTADRGAMATCPVAPPPLPARRPDGDFRAPDTLAELLVLRARNPEALVLGGGTDLGLRVSKAREQLPRILHTARVPELLRIEADDTVLTIGSAVTYTQALPHLDRHFPPFAALVRRIGSRQIRNLGTLAGNLGTASPIGDTLPVLMALGVSVTLRSVRGARTMGVQDFITGYRRNALAPDEIITSITLPLLPPDRHFAAYKLSKRFDQDISTVVAAFVLHASDGEVVKLRAAYGGMADRVRRAAAVERAMNGRGWSLAALNDAEALLAVDFAPMSDHRGGSAYRLNASAGLLRRFQIETTSDTIATRLEAL